jgi:hypothetical protein
MNVRSATPIKVPTSVVKRLFAFIDNINARKSRIVKRPLGLNEDRTIPGTTKDIKFAVLLS